MLNLERDSLILISNQEEMRKRFLQACEFLFLKPVIFDSLEDLISDEKVKPHTVLLDVGDNLLEVKPHLEKMEKSFSNEVDVFVIAVTSESILTQAQSLFLNHLIDRKQFLETFLAEFIIFHRGLCNFYEISVQDLFPDTTIPFNAYHYLPLNQKYVTLVNENLPLSEAKFKKIESARTLSIYRESANSYNHYIENYFDRFKIGLKKRLRSKFYQVFSQWREALLIGLAGTPKPNLFPGSLDDVVEQLKVTNEYLCESPDPWQMLFELSQLPIMQYERSALEMMVASVLLECLGELEVERLIEFKWALASCRILTPTLFFRRRYLSNAPLKPEELEQLKKFPQQLTVELSEDLKKDFLTYSQGFISNEIEAPTQGLYVGSYVAEKIVESFLSATSYSQSDILQGVMSRIKLEGRLNTAWQEQIRTLFAKGKLPQFKKGSVSS